MGDVIDLQERIRADIAATGELTIPACPICRDSKATLTPVVILRDKDADPYITHLMCMSKQCQGNTVIDVINGNVSEDERILED